MKKKNKKIDQEEYKLRITNHNHRCWCVRICKTKLCLCLDFFWQMGHWNLGSTPHSKRMCRLRLCGRAYEFPHRLHVYAPPVVVARCDDRILTAAFARALLLLPVPPPPLLLPPENIGSGTFVMLDGGVIGDVTDDDSSRKLIDGVSNRKSHGWSSGVGGVVLFPGFFTRDRLPPVCVYQCIYIYSLCLWIIIFFHF